MKTRRIVTDFTCFTDGELLNMILDIEKHDDVPLSAMAVYELALIRAEIERRKLIVEHEIERRNHV